MVQSTITKRQGTKLPHWTKKDGIYAIHFRLGDSLPQKILDQISFEREDIVRTAKEQNRLLSRSERRALHELHTEKIDTYLQNGYGACWLKRDDIATLVINALQHFENIRYRLFAWCIMQNHVHILVQPLNGYTLSSIVHSWKSFTAKEANKILGRSGTFWQTEYYDHLIRNDQDFHHAIEYIWGNPEAAGFKEWKWRWRYDEHGE